MKTSIEGYEIFPGEHCGSVAMRGLLNHYCGLDLPEAAVFGLGAGVDCAYLEGPGVDPAAISFGRTLAMEQDLAKALDLDYREEQVDDDDEAWRIVREEVMAGRPTMLSGDILYLDYREYKVHFPGHRFVLLGFDDDIEKAFIADRLRDEPEACSYGALARSRNAPEGLPSRNLWGKFHETAPGRTLKEAVRDAIRRASAHMLSGQGGRNGDGQESAVALGEIRLTTGLAGIRRLAEGIGEWAERGDAKWIASYNSQCIEKFGNGGGNFRRLYSGFLEWAREIDPSCVPSDAPARATRAADAWTSLSATLAEAAEDPGRADRWSEARRQALAIADIETALFEDLAAAV